MCCSSLASCWLSTFSCLPSCLSNCCIDAADSNTLIKLAAKRDQSLYDECRMTEKYLERAVKKGNSEAMYVLAKFIKEDQTQTYYNGYREYMSHRYMKMAAEKGHAGALRVLSIYEKAAKERASSDASFEKLQQSLIKKEKQEQERRAEIFAQQLKDDPRLAELHKQNLLIEEQNKTLKSIKDQLSS